MAALGIAEVNELSVEAFVERFGDVAEHSPWVAERAEGARPFASREAMIEAFLIALRVATPMEQIALIAAHPDLGDRARLSGDSEREQAGAGLDSLTADELEQFTALNARYRERFGFPFILAVKGATKHQILASFGARIGNEPELEFATALAQVARIIRFRIEDRVAP